MAINKQETLTVSLLVLAVAILCAAEFMVFSGVPFGADASTKTPLFFAAISAVVTAAALGAGLCIAGRSVSKSLEKIASSRDSHDMHLHGGLKIVADAISASRDDAAAKGRALEETQALVKALKTAAAGTILLYDDSGKILESHLCSGKTHADAFSKLVSADRNIRDVKNISEEALRSEIAKIDDAYERTACHVLRFSTSDDSGGTIWIEARLVRVRKGLLLANLRDITALHMAGLERAKLEERVAQLQKSESFGLMAGGLAHDYNNMLTAILGNVDLILNGGTSDTVREAAEDIKSAALRSSALIRRMFSSLDAANPEMEDVDLPSLIRDLARIIKRALPDSVSLVLEIDDKTPIVRADASQLWQIVLNLIMNACDALEKRPGIVKIAVFPEKFGLNELDGYSDKKDLAPGIYSVVEVEDNGKGMDEKTLAKIFDPFFTTKPKGRGLGLSSVMQSVRTYGGGILIRSQVEKGTSFRVILPTTATPSMPGTARAVERSEVHKTATIVPQSEFRATTLDKSTGATPVKLPPPPTASPDNSTNDTEEVAVKPESNATGSLQKYNILVVDDDVSILKLLGIILRTAGYCVTAASSGAEGFKVYRQQADKIDLCLMDVSMGAGMSGVELCSEIRKLNPDIPLLLMSAYRAKEMSSKMSISGVSGFLAKPFRGNDVIEFIAKYLKKAGRKTHDRK